MLIEIWLALLLAFSHSAAVVIRVPGLKQVARMWQKDRPQVLAIAEQLNQHLTHTASVSVVKGPVDNNPFKRVWHWCMSNFDPVNGGFGGAPKFPSTSLLRVLLRIHRRTGNLDPLNMVQRTLETACY